MKTIKTIRFHNCACGFGIWLLGLVWLTVIAPSPARAALKTWVGTGGTGNWSTAGNWSPSGAPAAGDDLSFPAGASGLLNTNNLTRNFSSIAFSGAGGGYVLRGNPTTLTNGVTAANSTGLNTIELNITNGANQTVTATTGGTLAISGDIALGSFTLTVNNLSDVSFGGVISGTGNLTKNGIGRLLLNGLTNNTYSGTTTVNVGTLDLNDIAGASVNMVVGPLVINNAGTVLVSEGNQIGDSVNVTINNGGFLNLTNSSDRIGSLTFNGSGVVSSSTLGLLTNGNITVNGSGSAPAINGNLHLGNSAPTFTVTNSASTLTINAAIASGFTGTFPFTSAIGFTKGGSGTLSLTASNSYGGATTVESGTLIVNNNHALGNDGFAVLFTDPTTYVSGNAVLLLNNAHITNETLTLSSTNANGALQDNLTGDWDGPIHLLQDVVIEASSLLQINGVVSGAGGFTKIGSNILRMTGTNANTYAGTTVVNVGTLELSRTNFDASIPGDLVIGDGVGSDTVRLLTANQIANSSHVSVNFGGLLDLNDHIEGIGDIEFTGGAEDAGTSTLVLFNGGVTANSHTNLATMGGNLSLNGQVREFKINTGHLLDPKFQVNGPIISGGITKTGSGNMRLAGTNTYTGLTTISNGYLEVASPFALGSTNSGTVLAGGELNLIGVTVTGESLTNFDFGYLDCFGSGGWTGNIVLNDFLGLGGNPLIVSGAISGNGPLEAMAGNTYVTLSGSVANTYTNKTIVRPGDTLSLNKTAVNGAIPADLEMQYLSTVLWLASNQVSDASRISMTNSSSAEAVLDLNGFSETVGSINGSGMIDLGSGGILRAGGDNTTATYSGRITNTGSLFKLGTGTWTLEGTNTFTGLTTVSAGTLAVNGVQIQSAVTVNGTASLAGSGSVGDTTVFGNLLPTGILTCSNLTFSSSAADYFVELTGPTAGTDYDQMDVRGTNALNSATLHLTVAFTTPVAVGQTFTIIKNDGSDAITGTFNGLAEGATITSGGYKFTLSYAGGTGNDVVLALTQVPGAALASAVSSGNGNHIIDPNECNAINLVITNNGGPMTGITATLSTADSDVIVSQPYSAYPTIALGGRGTNTTPFQISTLPTFVCGTDINLTLAVQSSSGAFIVPYVLRSGAAAATPTRYDNNTATSIPDIGAMDSTNTVTGFTGPLEKVTVSAYITHTKDSDLSLELVSPNGTSVLLVTNTGAGADFGTSSADVSRTTFDDSSATSITAGASPFVGTFRPMGALTNFNFNPTPNGKWKLHIVDKLGGTLGTLRNWSLFLYPVACTDGGGNCDYCLTAVTNSLTGTPIMTNRMARIGNAGSCGVPKAWPGIAGTGGGTNFHYRVHTFTNTSAADACVTVLLTASCNVQAGVYLTTFDPANIAANYLGDSGDSTGTDAVGGYGGGPQSCSVTVPAGATFVVEVNEILQGDGCSSYTLQLSGLPCPIPTLSISPAAATNSVRVHWPTWAGGYLLESNRSLTTPSWVTVTNEPLVNAGRFNVTNRMNPTNAFFRLKKP